MTLFTAKKALKQNCHNIKIRTQYRNLAREKPKSRSQSVYFHSNLVRSSMTKKITTVNEKAKTDI